MSRTRVRVELDRAAIDAIGSWVATQGRMVEVGNAVGEATARNTPVVRGLLQGGVTVDAGSVDAQGAVCVVGSNYAGAVPAEVGTVHSPPYAMFQKGVRECGLRMSHE